MARVGSQAAALIVPRKTSAWWKTISTDPLLNFSNFSSLAFITELLNGFNLLGTSVHYIPNSPVLVQEGQTVPKCYPAIITKVTTATKNLIMVNLLWRDDQGVKHAENGIRYQGFIEKEKPTKDPWLYPNYHSENHFPSLYPPAPASTGTYQSQPLAPQYNYVRVPDAAPSSTFSGCSTISDSTLNGGEGTTICWDKGVETFRAVGLTNDQAGQVTIDFNNGAYHQADLISNLSDIPAESKGSNLGLPYIVEAWDKSENGEVAGWQTGANYRGASAIFPNLRKLGLHIPPEANQGVGQFPSMCSQEVTDSKTAVIQYVKISLTGEYSYTLGVVYDCSGNDYWVAFSKNVCVYPCQSTYPRGIVLGQGPINQTLSNHTLTIYQKAGTVNAQPPSDNDVHFVVDSIVVSTVQLTQWRGANQAIVGVENRNNMSAGDVKLYGSVIKVPTHTITSMKYYLTGLTVKNFAGRDVLTNNRPELTGEWTSDTSMIVRSNA